MAGPIFEKVKIKTMAFKTAKYELVELLVPGVAGGQTQTQWSFPDLPKLRYTSLMAMETFGVDQMTVSPNNVAVSTAVILQKSYLVLYANERQDLYRIPLISLVRTQATTGASTPFVRALYEFNGQKVTWDKSFVQIASAPGNTSNYSYIFGVYYI
jgi:hypothetical protein